MLHVRLFTIVLNCIASFQYLSITCNAFIAGYIICDRIFNRHQPEVNLVATIEVDKSYALYSQLNSVVTTQSVLRSFTLLFPTFSGKRELDKYYR